MEYQILYEDYRKSLGAGRKKIKTVRFFCYWANMYRFGSLVLFG